MSTKPRIIIIAGPTGVGKSSLALLMARQFGGEIVNSDAMQVYRHMDIGTAKPGRDELLEIRHHLIDIVDPDEEFNAALFAAKAGEAILELDCQGRPAIVAGGTGLYIKALTRGLFKAPGADPALRKRFREVIRKEGTGALHRELALKDPEAAAKIHPHDAVRIIRALEILEKSGETVTEKHREHGFREEPYETLKIGLSIDRKGLYERIDSRCREMVDRGLIREVEGLIKMGYGRELKPMQSLGYRQIVRYLHKEYELDAALEEMMRETRRYAKRQLTWFRADPEIEWHEPADIEAIQKKIATFISRR